MKRLLIALIVLPILLGVALRSVEVVTKNFVFGFDQGLDIFAARSIAVDHKFTLIGAEAGAGFAGLPGLFHGPGYYYFLAATHILSGGNPYGPIVALWAISIAELVALAAIVFLAFGHEAALVALFFGAISPMLIAHGRMEWAPNGAGLVVLPFLYVLFSLASKKPLFLFLSTFLAASLYHFELPLAIPTVVGVFLYVVGILGLRSFRTLGLLFGGAIAGFLPMILFELRHGARLVSSFTAYTSRTGGAPFRPFFELAGDGQALMSQFFDAFPTIPRITGLLLLILFAWALRNAYRKEKVAAAKRFVQGMLCIIAAHALVFYPYRGPVYPHYLSLLTYLYIALVSFVLGRNLVHEGARRVIGLGVILLFAVVAVSLYPKTILYDYKDYGGTAKIVGKKDAIDAIYKDAAGKSFGLFIFSPPVYTYPYDYLLVWYAAPTYGFSPTQTKDGLFYLLIEPDPQQPWSYKGWQETVIKAGVVEATWELPSGFIIERRRGNL